MEAENLLNQMFDSLETSAVLRMILMQTKKTNKLVFVFEGDDDFTYYESSIMRSGFTLSYEHIPAKGKKQVVDLYNELVENEQEELLDNTYFFVDQDYDKYSLVGEDIFNLEVYAIENYLSERAAIDSVLKDELKLNSHYSDARLKYLDDFDKAYKSFGEVIKNLSHYLCLCRHLGLPQKFPKLSPHYIDVETTVVSLNNDFRLDYLAQVESFVSSEQLYSKALTELPLEQLIRGKYVFWFIKKWFMAVKDDINSKSLYPEELKLADDFITIRRLSHCCSINTRLCNFVKNIQQKLQ